MNISSLVENADFDADLDDIFDDLFRVLFVSGVFLEKSVEVVEKSAGSVVDEHFGDRLGRHFRQNLLLRFQPHRQRAECGTVRHLTSFVSQVLSYKFCLQWFRFGLFLVFLNRLPVTSCQLSR